MNQPKQRHLMLRPAYMRLWIPALIFVVLMLIWPRQLQAVLAPFVVSLILAYVLDPLVRWIDSYVSDRWLALGRIGTVLMLYVVIGILLLTVGTYVGFRLTKEIQGLANNASRYAGTLISSPMVRIRLDDRELVSGWIELDKNQAERQVLRITTLLPADEAEGTLEIETVQGVKATHPLTVGGPWSLESATSTTFSIARALTWPDLEPLTEMSPDDIIVLELHNLPQGLLEEQDRLWRYADILSPALTHRLINALRVENLGERLAHYWPLLAGGEYQQATDTAQRVARGAVGGVAAMLSGVASGTLAVIGFVVFLLFVLLITFYLLVDFERFKDFVRSLIPGEHRSYYLRLAGEVDQQLAAFLRGQAMICLGVGLATTVGLYILSFWFPVQYPILIGIWAGVSNIVPYLGPAMGAAPALLFTWAEIYSTGQGSMLWSTVFIGGLFALIQTLDGMVVTPKVMGDSVQMHPMVILFALLVGGQLMGVLGMLLAVPGACVLRVILREIYFPSSSAGATGSDRGQRGREARHREGTRIREESVTPDNPSSGASASDTSASKPARRSRRRPRRNDGGPSKPE